LIIRHVAEGRLTSPNSIFFPPGHDAASPSPLPTIFTIHGGGFVAGSPDDVNPINARYAAHGFLVITLRYTLAPAGHFPIPIHDIEAIILAALDDTSLPINPRRVALMGWSAGGNIAVSVAQLPSLQGRIAALVPVYPVADWRPPAEEKLPTRQWKPELGGHRGKPADGLMMICGLVEWAYLPPGQDFKDPLLSTVFTPRETLPSKVFIISAELDMLSHEGLRLAWGLAGREGEPPKQVGALETKPPGELVLDDERYHFEKGGVRWLLVPDTIHGFDMDMGMVMNDKVAVEDGKIKSRKVHDLVAEWLLEVTK
jgi:acetyl esterase/lipase